MFLPLPVTSPARTPLAPTTTTRAAVDTATPSPLTSSRVFTRTSTTGRVGLAIGFGTSRATDSLDAAPWNSPAAPATPPGHRSMVQCAQVVEGLHRMRGALAHQPLSDLHPQPARHQSDPRLREGRSWLLGEVRYHPRPVGP